MTVAAKTAALESPSTNPPATSSKNSHRRRRWWRWLVGGFVALVLFVAFLPTLAALPMFRSLLFSAVFRGLNERVTVDRLSLGWFSPIRAGGVQLHGDEGSTPALAIDEIAGDASLWKIITGKELGEFQILQPQVFVQFDESGSNWGRLIKELHGTPKLDKAVRLKIVDAKVSLQGASSPQPWSLDKLSTSVAFSPAIANSYGVPLIQGDKLTLLNKAELTPELCNDLLKYIVPSLAGVAKTSGQVSLEVDEYLWPIGKPSEANVKGRLTLHSVDMGPGSIADSLAGAMQGLNLPASLKVAQDDTVTFWVENGRVHHQDFAFGLIDLQPDRLIRTHGSVGFDQTLDVVIDMPIIGSAYLPEGPLRESLMKKNLTIEVGGTLQAATTKFRLPADADFSPALKAVGDFWKRRQEQIRDKPQQRGLLRNRRKADDSTAPKQ
jgi:hypothetical protein